MRLPSLEALATAARRTLARFPTVLLAALITAAAGVIVVEGADAAVEDEFWYRFFGTAALAIPLFVAIDLFAERRRWGLALRAGCWLAGAAGLAGFMVGWYGWSAPVAAARYVTVSAAFHLLVAFVPFSGAGQIQGFWQYNKTLFLRLLTGAIFTGVLYAGLAVALLALDNLFGLNVPGERYPQLWIVLAFLFNTWFFLGGLPEPIEELDRRTDYPTGLKIFAQYVLVPLVIVYLVILTLYLGKVLLTQEWPSGWIGWLVSSVAAAGIFSLLLVHPIAEQAENRWMRTYARGFYLAILPSIVMLWLAIWKRVDQYGMTERRYFLTVLSVWLAAIALFYALRRSRDIRIIPASLCLVGLATLAGPWGAYSISESSQIGRLRALLTRYEMLEDGVLRPSPSPLPFDDRREVSAIVRYLVETHGTDGISAWFGGSLATVDTTERDGGPSPQRDADARAELITGLMGVEYVGRWAGAGTGRFNYSIQWDRAEIPVEGFDAMMSVDNLVRDSAVLGDRFTLRYDSAAAGLEVRSREEILASLPILPLLDSAATARRQGPGGGLPPSDMRLDISLPSLRLAIYVSYVSGYRSAERLEVSRLGGRLFYSLRE
jgi:hypothetical protein